MQNNKPKVGVVVPIYKVELQLVKKCIVSIVEQSYRNIEIILVDDGNEVAYVEKIKEFTSMDDRIHLIHHKENKGLFKARLTGVEYSSANYITFVDADDSITIDWIRLLVKNALKYNSDIVMGKTVNMDSCGRLYVYNANYSFCNRPPIYKNEIFEMLMQDRGLDFSIHTVWNKLYSKKLWERAWNDLCEIDKHLVMTEDILFSFVLFYYAEIMSFSNHDGYIYYRNENSSTLSSYSYTKIKKYIEDISIVFSSVERFLSKKNVLNNHSLYWQEWKDRYFRWWSYNVKNVCVQLDLQEAQEISSLFLRIFDKDEIESTLDEDSYFGEKRTGWNDALETIKRAIVSKEYEVVSFDLFDTLIMRPVLNPDDVFEIVLNDLDIQLSERKHLKQLRKIAEREARRKIRIQYPQYEDVTLTEIYNTLNSDFQVSYEMCEKLKKCEVKVEIEFAQKRQTGYELYTLAKECGKKIFITSDMYLEMEAIKEILKRNEYYDCKILLSSEERLLKSTGHLFEKLLSESSVRPDKIIHIGDNWESDGIKPTCYGIKSFFIPKSKDILLNYLGDINTGNAAGNAVENFENIIDTSGHFDSFPVRSMYAICANKMFDNPYVSFNGKSDYNGDPYYLGSFALGMHMFSIAKWISDLVDKMEYNTVHFVARDGYYLKKIYDRIRQNKKENIGYSNYLYASRKSLIPLQVEASGDIKKIFVNTNINSETPRKIINKYDSILKPLTQEIEDYYKKRGFLLDVPFENEEVFFRFVSCMQEIQYSSEKMQESLKDCKKYLQANIKEGDIIFDLGYSGNLHSQIIKAIGFNVHGAYINFSGYDAIYRNKKEKLNIESYYDFIPCMSGIVTEYIFSDRGPSCLRYKNGKPVFEEKIKDNIGDYIIQEINRGAFDFADKFLSSWSARMNMMDIAPIDAGLQFEKFLVAPTNFDKEIFNCCYAEDEYYGEIKRKSLTELWDWQLLDRHVKHPKSNKVVEQKINVELSLDEMAYQVYLKRIHKRGLFTKALYWMCVNKNFFYKRIKDYLRNRAN